ncbi:unnamed protein product [Urochloa humidicola]
MTATTPFSQEMRTGHRPFLSAPPQGSILLPLGIYGSVVGKAYIGYNSNYSMEKMAASTEEHDQKKLVVLTIHDSVTSLGELYGVNSLRSTTSVGNEKKRQRVYNTMFQIPWRCEQMSGQGWKTQVLMVMNRRWRAVNSLLKRYTFLASS